MLSRRAFAGGVAGLALAGPLTGTAWGQAGPGLEAALAAIRAYAAAHMAMFNLPGLTLGLTAPGGFATSFDLGLADLESGRAISPDTLFQIGSISKLMTALMVHQLAAEGRFALSDPIARLLPTVPVPRDSGITVQHLLDHRSGLPGDAPLFPPGGLWTGYPPGTHWSYSNTGYDILGKLAESAGDKPLDRLLAERLFKPLGMGRTKGAIIAADRLQYAQGYVAANDTIPYARGVPLAPAGWVDVTFAAGNVASTAADMNRLIAALAAALKGGTMPGLNAAQTAAYLDHSAPTDSAAMRYGNGFMHVSNAARHYLHHTGGMVSTASAFHLDKASGVGALASTTLTGLAGYRPSSLTRFAVDALTEALAGRPLPKPPRLDDRVDAAAFIGRYSGPSGAFEVLPGAPLIISAGDRSAPLQAWGGNQFRTTHPEFARYCLLFERLGPRVTGASWGPAQFAKQGAPNSAIRSSDPALVKLAGRFSNDSPWWGVIEIVERGGRLWLGTEMPLIAMGGDLWRIGDDKRSPERGRFADPIDGRPQSFYFSGEKFIRHDI